MKKYILILITLCFFTGIANVSAESEYYNYRWTYHYEKNDSYYMEMHEIVTNDMIAVPEGFLAVGFDHEYGDRPRIKLLDHDGNQIKEISLSKELNGKLKEIIQVGNRYYIFGGFDDNVIYVVLDEKYNVIAQNTEYNLDIDWDPTRYDEYYENEGFEVYIEYYNGYFYIYDPDVHESIVKASEYLIDMENVYLYELSEDELKFLEDRFEIGYYTDDDLVPVFIAPYDGGIVYGLEEKDYPYFYVSYVKNGKEVWYKEYYNAFIRDAIEFNGKLIMVGYFDDNQVLITLDKNGKLLDEDSIDNYDYYLKGENFFMSEHLVTLDHGFALTGMSCGEEEPKPHSLLENEVSLYFEGDDMPRFNNCSAEILYFDIDYNVYTKTDGNGMVTPSATTAYAKEEITFEVTPNEGYKVAYVNVTDEYGNTVTFPSNKFTMPYADVTIEAAFTIENPKTGAKIGAITFGALILAVPALVTRKRKDKLFNV